jgi:hypothetical protein
MSPARLSQVTPSCCNDAESRRDSVPALQQDSAFRYAQLSNSQDSDGSSIPALSGVAILVPVRLSPFPFSRWGGGSLRWRLATSVNCPVPTFLLTSTILAGWPNLWHRPHTRRIGSIQMLCPLNPQCLVKGYWLGGNCTHS